MKKIIIGVSAVVILLSGIVFAETPAKQPVLDEKTMELIQAAVYEVIVPKPAKDSLTYEKPLPLDLIPYAIRTDKYYSIGTAFAVAPDRFVSAAHVMPLDSESQYEEVFLRDTSGNVYSIDKIIKYSDHRDFVVFTLKDKKAERFFNVNDRPKLNQIVYAVGNALGQGIVVRDGLYTSNTPEEEKGEWKWIRFSAAASPGNSGGPLLDKEGAVIGIVLRKSENENLNYALPISEMLKAKENLAVAHKKTRYVIDNMDMTKTADYDAEIKLPLSYRDLNNALVKSFNVFADRLLKEFFAENKKDIFPNGAGSTALLYKTYSAYFPHMIMRREDGNWDAFTPKETQTAELGDNGFLTYGGMADSLFIYMQKPDSIPLKKFYEDSKLFMDLVLKGVYFYRQISSEKVKIISMGKAQEEYTFTDSWGRKWLVRTWLMEYSDEKILTFSLPIPGGFITIMKGGQTGRVNNGYLPDMKVLADFIYVSYYGTFKEWKEFLTLKDRLPAGFSAIDISYEKDRFFSYASSRFSVRSVPEVMHISDRSDLSLYFGFFDDNGKVVWDVLGIAVGEDKNTKTNFSVYRLAKPPKELRDVYHKEWENAVARKFPYNSSVYFEDGRTVISTVSEAPKGTKVAREQDFLYTITYAVEGKAEQADMEKWLNRISESLKVHEGRQTQTLAGR